MLVSSGSFAKLNNGKVAGKNLQRHRADRL